MNKTYIEHMTKPSIVTISCSFFNYSALFDYDNLPLETRWHKYHQQQLFDLNWIMKEKKAYFPVYARVPFSKYNLSQSRAPKQWDIVSHINTSSIFFHFGYLVNNTLKEEKKTIHLFFIHARFSSVSFDNLQSFGVWVLKSNFIRMITYVTSITVA